MQKIRENIGRTFWDFLVQILDRKFWKILGFLIILFFLSLPALKILEKVIPNLTIFNASNFQKVTDYNIYLPASRLWLNTGIKVKEGQEIEIRASGAVHVAVHHLIWNSMADVKPINNWIYYPNPSEIENANYLEKDNLKRNEIKMTKEDSSRFSDCAISSSFAIGTLLIYFCEEKSDSVPTTFEPFRFNRRNLFAIIPKDDISNVSNECIIKKSNKVLKKSPCTGTIFMVINDNVALNSSYINKDKKIDLIRIEELKQIENSFKNKRYFNLTSSQIRSLTHFYGFYVGNIPENPEEIEKIKQQRWRELSEINYNNQLWFDDNIGGYLINVRMMNY